MTTFGGHTVPPLFGGAAQDGIFIRDVATSWHDVDNNGGPFTTLALPIRQPGDLLWCFNTSYGGDNSAAPGSGVWNTIFIGGGSMTLYWRVATNTGADNFNSNGYNNSGLDIQWFKQIISIASNDPAKNVEIFEEGPTTSANLFDMPLAALGAGAEPTNTFVLAMYLHFAFTGLPPIVPTMGSAVGFNLIEEHKSNENQIAFPAQQQYYHVGWGSQYQQNSVAVPAQTIALFPTVANGSSQARTLYYRFRAV